MADNEAALEVPADAAAPTVVPVIPKTKFK